VGDGTQTVDQILIKHFLAAILTGVIEWSQASKTSEIEADDKEARAKIDNWVSQRLALQCSLT
jgi:hypothetical protein